MCGEYPDQSPHEGEKKGRPFGQPFFIDRVDVVSYSATTSNFTTAETSLWSFTLAS